MSDKAIWKYAIPKIDAMEFEMELPRGAVIVHFGEDLAGVLSFWASVDTNPEAPKDKVQLALVWTGTERSEEWIHIGTSKHMGLIWHLMAKCVCGENS